MAFYLRVSCACLAVAAKGTHQSIKLFGGRAPQVANYEPFCRSYSKDKALAEFLVNPCLPKRADAWQAGRCCRCDLAPSAYAEEPLDAELAAKLAALQRLQSQAPHALQAGAATTRRQGGVQPLGGDALAQQQASVARARRESLRDDDDLARVAPGRVPHLPLGKALHNTEHRAPAWMEAP